MTVSQSSNVANQVPADIARSLLILGGGQLSRMLTLSAHAMGVCPTVLCESATEPAPQVGAKVVLGNERSEASLQPLFAQSGMIATFENEFLDVKALQKAAKDTAVIFRPSLTALATLQDKLLQKKLLLKCGVPHSRYEILDEQSPEAELKRAQAAFPNGFVLKWARLGYDGKGTWISPAAFQGQWTESALAFLVQAKAKGVAVFAEEKIAFSCEVAMVAARAVDGAVACYPLVISEQEQGICKWVRGPARGLGVAASLELAAKESLEKLLNELDYVGILACEFFVTADQRLLVNELAPRVHNSAHYSQNASTVSQFDNHIRAVLGMTVQEPQLAPYFMMGNLIGPPKVRLPVSACPLSQPLPEHLSLHWYGKSEIRPGRKVGHVNGVAQSRDEFVKLEAKLRAFVKHWEHGLSTARGNE